MPSPSAFVLRSLPTFPATGELKERQAAPKLLAALLCLLVLLAPAYGEAPGEAHEAHQAQKPPQTSQEALHLWPEDSVSHHVLIVGAERYNYTATAGTLPLLGEKGETTAKIFYVSYALEGAPPRPLTFVFNGGPGAAAAFLHLGALGPRVVNFNAKGSAPVEPVGLADNPDSWLPFTDLVFVDPVGTGYSRATGGSKEAEKAFWGVDKDADAMSAFVQRYLAKNGRELSLVFLAGESYGGFRVCLLSDRLLDMGVQVEGAILISPALEFSMIRGDSFTLLPLALALPSLAAAHIELKEGPGASLAALGEVEKFARDAYLRHLVQGFKQEPDINAKLANYTGLKPDVVARNFGRVSVSLFAKEFRRENDRALSVYDGSVSVPLPHPPSGVHFDPILDVAVSVLTPAMTQYARQELGYRTNLHYELLNRSVSGHWDFGTKPNRQGYAGALDDLEKARAKRPRLRVFIAQGYTDLVIPYGISQYLVDQLRPIDSAAPVELRLYKGGHMMYMRPDSRRDLKIDASKIYSAAMADR